MTDTWFTQIPKVELHVHLEGDIPLETLWQLVQKYGGDAAVPDIAALEKKFVYQDFPHFIETWMWKNQFLREYEDFTLIAEDVARGWMRQNIRYVEAFYSPTDFARHNLEPHALTQAIRRGWERVPEIEVALVADLVRSSTSEVAMYTLAQLREVQDLDVVGIGIGGAEQLYPPELFAEVYAQARAWDFHTSAHAGEAAGPESIWGAMRALEVERIGHGTRAEEDPALLDYLVAHQIPLEMCPISNVCTAVVPSLAQHPLRRSVEKGVFVTVNTDDPQMFGNDLASEYAALVATFDFNRADIEQLILNGIRASWLAEGRKTALHASFEIAFAEVRV